MARIAGDNQEVLEMALKGYEAERTKIDEKIRDLRARLGRRGPGRPPSAAKSAGESPKRKRNLSPEARKRIAAAQKKRWAEHRKQKAQNGE